MSAPGAPRLRVLHAIHDFLPRHRAGSEIYALELCRELERRHWVTVLAAEFDPSRPHGHVTWRAEAGLPVAEIVNNWRCGSFADTYRSAAITEQLGHVLDMVQPDVLHLHSLLNLSFDLPAAARARGIPVAATLHDYTLVCPSGGQRVHRSENHLCTTIEPARCERCFRESPFYSQIGVGNIASAAVVGSMLKRAAGYVISRIPSAARPLAAAARRGAAIDVTEAALAQRLDEARTRVFELVDLFVAPSRSIRDEFEALGVSRAKLRVLDHGFVPLARSPRQPAIDGPLRIGFVGTLVWHKGVHVLIDAVRALDMGAYELRIFGDVNVFPDYVADLRRRSEGLPVRFMGEFDRARMGEAYADLDVLVIPSLWPENSPLVIREAFMAGVPVVGARIGGIGELVTDGENGLLYEPGSPEGLTKALALLVADRPRLSALAGRIPAVKTMEAHAQEWEAIYAELLDRAAVPSRTGTAGSQVHR